MTINRIKYMILAAVALSGITSCEKDLEPYSNPDSYLNFIIKDLYGDEATTETILEGDTDAERQQIYNFKFNGDAVQDTMWIEAKTSGYVTDYDREFALEQVMVEGEENAVAGTDYVPFDSPDATKCMVVKAGENRFKVPVIVLRSEKMKSKSVILKIRFKANDNFKSGFAPMQERILSITDRLAKPSVWDQFYLDYYLGLYGEMKHQLMIEWTGKPWDDNYLTELYNDDSAYIDYMDQVFAKRLAEENEERKAQGLDIYREADGSPVDFTPESWY